MIEINQSDLDDINKTFKKLDEIDKHKALKEFVDGVYEDAISKADEHTKTGALIKSIFLKRHNNDYYIGVDDKLAPYGVFVHWGTKPHTITPNKRRALRWAGKNGFNFAKKVEHPGYKGDPFLILALNSGYKKLPQLFNKLTKDL